MDPQIPWAIRPGLTRVVSAVVAGTSVVLAVAAFFGFRLAPRVRSGEVDISAYDAVPSSAEVAYAAWSMAAILAFVLSGVLVIAWMHTASKAMDARGPDGRRWKGGWAIWGWIIPIGNLFIPKLMFGEVERIAQEPFDGESVEGGWRERTRTGLADVWWGLWVAGLLVSQVGYLISGEGLEEAEVAATSIQLGSASFAVFAAAGIVLSLVVRRTEVFSRR